ncbi:MAG: SH3 domain-containing protein [Lachnospiraceae bacterium]
MRKPQEYSNGLSVRCKDWIIRNIKIVIPASIVIVVLLTVLVFVVTAHNHAKPQETGAQAGMEPTTADGIVPEEPLEENAYPEVNALIDKYYKALADGDIGVIEHCRNYTEDTEKTRLEKKSQYIESYQNITCYTKKGMLENTYLAYVYYEVKFKGIDTVAPALNTLYICPNEAGELYIYEGEIDSHVSSYLTELSVQDNVVELSNRVEVKYNDAIASDEALSTFLNELPTKIKTEVGEAIAKEAASETVSDNNVETKPEETTSEAQDTEPAVPQVIETIEATDTINVRSSDSETADKIGKAPKGEQYKRLESKANGWSKIEFEGKEAYVKSEYVKVVNTTEEKPQTDTATDNESPAATDASSGGKATVKETVNIRKSASTTSDLLGTAYMGEKFDVMMKQADGWTKIKYKGQTAYVKSEFLE